MKRFFSLRKIITIVILLAAGFALAFFSRRDQTVTWQVLAADTLFCQASVVLFWGAVLLLGNLHMFTSFTYGFRNLHRLVHGNSMKSGEMKEDYLQYRNSRRHHDDVSFYLTAGAVLLAFALAAGFIV